jgi:hypothetical protein
MHTILLTWIISIILVKWLVVCTAYTNMVCQKWLLDLPSKILKCIGTRAACMHRDKKRKIVASVCYCDKCWSHIVVAVADRLQAGQSRLVSCRGKRFSVLQNILDWIWGPHSLLFCGYGALFLVVKGLGCDEVNHSPLCTPITGCFKKNDPISNNYI